MMQVGVIDYGAGNIFSILAGLRRANIDAEIVRNPCSLIAKDAVVVPGVGNFSQAARALTIFKEQLEKLADEGRYILGICLGMQIFLEESEEGTGAGLGFINGCVNRLPESVKVPHMGWNTIEIKTSSELLDGLANFPYFYFVHSFVVNPTDSAVITATTEYGETFPSIVENNSILGVQFHPEKSGDEGATILKNFGNMIRR